MLIVRRWMPRIIGAMVMIGVVHAFMLWLNMPTFEAWCLGSLIYTGLVAVLFSRKSLIDKLGTYVIFIVVTVAGALTVCPCTGAQFIFGPLAGLITLGLLSPLKKLVFAKPESN